MATNDAVTFIRNASRTAFPSSVSKHLRVRVLDTLAAMTAGYQLSTSGIIHDYATDRFADASEATLLNGTGNRASLEATTLTNATAANALDIDDGHREVKGHPAAIVVPAALAAAEVRDATISAFLDAVLVGYEIGTRVGLAIHATDDVYTGTGSWGAVGAAAAVGRLFGFDAETLRATLGIAEYHAPRTPIMRGVEQPGMTKDGIGWGAYAGVASALLAERGFTGSGTVFDENTIEVTDSLGKQLHVTNGYLKPYPCCRWAQPGVAATLALDDRHRIDPDTVRRVRIETFEAATHLRTSEPASAEAAEYSYPYPVATAVARGRFTPEDLQVAAREDPTIVSLANQVELTVNETLEEQFPAKCLARVTIETDTETYRSNVTEPPGARSRPLSTAKRLMKARQLLTPVLDESEIAHLRTQLTHPNRPISTLLDPWHKEE